jgi:hypothetical protein
MAKERNTRVRIDFIVREVCDDGSVPDDDLKFIKFGDEVSHGLVKDFFDRSGHAMGLMFRSCGDQVLSFVDVGANKIAAIKVVRELTNLGLKEAKDLVESAPGTPFLIVENHDDVRFALKAFEHTGAKVNVSAHHDSGVARVLPLARYVRRI